MSTAYRLGPHWSGYIGIKKLIIFGDTYSYIGYHARAPPPSSSHPLGVPFPGTPVTESGRPNWVGHLITSYPHGQSNMLVYDYAVRGDTVPGVAKQVTQQFLPTVGRKPAWAAWSSWDSLFVTWIGTDDCRLMYTNERSELKPIVSYLFAAQEQLYATGARNFMLIDVPPIQRSPIGPTDGSDGSVRFRMWNEELRAGMATFTAIHPDCTVLLFSAWDVFNRVLDNPVAYGFNAQDIRVLGGSFWFDHIHPTSKFHDILACEIARFLTGLPPQYT
ncbi:hypothetical protein BV25DRAFT_1915248 [Artomyces pyxidatus]|uniref:Uncharacterized protein n=1 Tax=Artomyces pyxidatus TaxID=48021 RepID=A0ACB8T5Z0_9AGAM|nr:hypothetical protein BV25DRAFT_1915248 [Artomyces pyxidatus]